MARAGHWSKLTDGERLMVRGEVRNNAETKTMINHTLQTSSEAPLTLAPTK